MLNSTYGSLFQVMPRRRFCLTIFFLAASPIYSQVAGRLTGTVVDATGASIPDAKVSLFLTGGANAILTTQTTSEGLFEFASVRPDFYRLTVERSGFTTFTQENVKVDPSRVTSLPPVRLEITATAQTVEVSAAAQSIDTATAEVSATVTQSQVENLPVLDRQVRNLFITQAGVSNSRTVSSLNGLRPSYSNILLDGVQVQDVVRTNALDLIPNRLTIGQVAEVTIASSNLNPTIGGNATAVSLSTPSGRNEFFGNAYWYNRNNAFSANDWFNNQAGVDRPFLNLNQVGGTLGGPAVKDKLLFFANYEAFRQRQQSPVTNTILTAPARQGIYTYRDTAGQIRTLNVLQQFGLQADPVVQNFINALPAAGNTTARGDQLNTTGYTFNAASNDDRNNYTGKLDYYLSPSSSFFGSYLVTTQKTDRPDYTTFYSTTPPIYNDSTNHFLSAGWRWSPSATLTNELRGGFNRQSVNWVNREQNPEFIVTGLNFSPPLNTKLPEGRKVHTYVIQDNANWVKGKHTVSFGFQAMMWRNPSFDYAAVVPSYGIGIAPGVATAFAAGQIPGGTAVDVTRANALLASLAGLYSTAAQTFNITSRDSGFVPLAPQRLDMRMNNYAPYISDNWRVTRRLALTFGLRWEYFSPVDEANSLLIQPYVASGNPVEALLGDATLDFAGSAAGRRLYRRDRNNFAPNFGFAWDPTGNGRTSLRGGYSIAYANDNTINTVYNTVAVNNGLRSTINLANLAGRLTGNRIPIPTPPFEVPTTSEAQFQLQPSSPPVQGLVNPELATPYVQQWNFSIQRELKGFVLEGRYIGNHVVKQFRVLDFNQIDVRRGGFLDDFIRARNNGLLAAQAGLGFNPNFNANIPGSQRLTFFPTLPGGGFLTNPAVQPLILSGEVGTLGQLYQSNFILPSDDFSFFPNYRTLYSSMLTNLSHSTYNGAQFEIRRRTRNGMQFQANYTFSKALSDAEATRGLEAQLDNNNRSIEKARSPFDLTHAFKLNHYVPLPFGPGRRFNPGHGLLRRLAEGWGVSGFLIVQSGAPLSIESQRGTLNRGARSALNTVDTNLTLSELKAITGVYKRGDGVYFIDPAHINPVTRQGVAPDGQAPFSGQVFFNPQPGTLGSLQRRILDGPGYWNYDFALIKDTKITERQSIQFRADFYNVFNHPGFWPGPDGTTADHNINTATFGRITEQYYNSAGVGPRVIQFGLFYRF